MAKATLGQWLVAMNALREPRDRSEAERSARVFFVCALLGFAASALATLSLFGSNSMSEMMAQQYSVMGLSAREIEFQQAFMDAIMPYAMAMSVGFSVVFYTALSIAQWHYMTRAIPAVVLAFGAYSLLANLIFRLTGFATLGLTMPVWLSVLTWSAFLGQVVICIASLRGAIMLNRIRRAV